MWDPNVVVSVFAVAVKIGLIAEVGVAGAASADGAGVNFNLSND